MVEVEASARPRSHLGALRVAGFVALALSTLVPAAPTVQAGDAHWMPFMPLETELEPAHRDASWRWEHATYASNLATAAGWATVRDPGVSPYGIAVPALEAVEHRLLGQTWGTGIYPASAFSIDTGTPFEVVGYTDAAPYDGTGDATRLLPTSSLGKAYHVVTYQEDAGFDDATHHRDSFVAVVGTAHTDVTVDPAVATLAGGAVPALSPGIPATFALEEGDTLLLLAHGDLTGTSVTGTQVMAVFAGSTCTTAGTASVCAHMDEQMLPDADLGQTMVACSFVAGGVRGGQDIYRIFATPYRAEVVVTPPPAAFPGGRITVPAGGHVDFTAATDLVVASDEPIALLQVYAGGAPRDSGSPSMALHVPVEAYGALHVFEGAAGFVPHASVAMASGASATLNGAAFGTPRPIGTTGYSCATATATSRSNVVRVSGGSASLQVFGTSDLTSCARCKPQAYWWVGGAPLPRPAPPPPPEELTPPPPPPPRPPPANATDPTADTDRDGVQDDADDCPQQPNRDQGDGDRDGMGDACDPSPCPPGSTWVADANRAAGGRCERTEQALRHGNATVADRDGDGVPDAADLCPAVRDPEQRDGDGDVVGDACDPDADGDGVLDPAAAAPPGGAATEAAGLGMVLDNCPGTPNTDQRDADADGVGDACDGNAASRARPNARPNAGISAQRTDALGPLALVGALAVVAFASRGRARRPGAGARHP